MDEFSTEATQGDARRKLAEAEIKGHKTTSATPPIKEVPSGDAPAEVGEAATQRPKDHQATQGVAYMSLGDNPLIISEAIALLHMSGIQLKERTLQRYCQERAHGLFCEKRSTVSGQEWHVSEASLKAFVRDNPDRQDTERQATQGDASALIERREPQKEPETKPSAELPPTPAYDTDQIQFLREQIKVKDTQIATSNGQITALLERDRETNVLIQGLQQMVLRLQPPKTEREGDNDTSPPANSV